MNYLDVIAANRSAQNAAAPIVYGAHRRKTKRASRSAVKTTVRTRRVRVKARRSRKVTAAGRAARKHPKKAKEQSSMKRRAKRNAKGRFVKAAESPRRRRRSRKSRRSSAGESTALTVYTRKTPRRSRRAAPRGRRAAYRRRATVIAVRPSTRGRRRISYKTRGRRRTARAIVIRPQRRGRRRVRITRVTSRKPRRMLLENPLTGGELIIIAVTGLLGAGSADMTDRFIATHALKAGDFTGTFSDAPGAGQVYNYQAVAAPMGWQRWLAGVGGTAVPLALGAYVKSPGWRSALQGIGIGWGLRTLNKGLTDLFTMLFGKSQFGERMYADEIKAKNAHKTATTMATGATALPTPDAIYAIGLALPPKVAHTNCSKCARQVAVGTGCPCTQSAVQQPAATQRPTGVGAPPALNPAPAPVTHPAFRQPVAASSWRARQSDGYR